MKITVGILLLLARGVVLGSAPQVTSPAVQADPIPRPGIAVRLMPGGGTLGGFDVIIALDYLTKPEQTPRFVGVRFYTYQVQPGPKPTRIGYVADGKNYFRVPTQTVILGGRKYFYTDGGMDRQENGSISIERAVKSSKYHIQGVYSYGGQLFVLDMDIALGGEFFLYEKPSEAGTVSSGMRRQWGTLC